MNSTKPGRSKLTTGQAATLACLLEVAVPKVGNVHRGADFDDSTLYDFLASSVAIGNVFARAEELSIGQLVLKSVQATRELVGTNTNLGMILLFAPIAKISGDNLSNSINDQLNNLNNEDRDLIYEAIREAQPGGLGKVTKGDVNESNDSSQLSLIESMRLAADRDLIAKQYADGFQEMLEFVLPAIDSAFHQSGSLVDALILAHLRILAEYPDSLIARKCGTAVATECQVRAEKIVNSQDPGSPDYLAAIDDLDFWLRSDGHRRNPGTSADLIAGGIFLALRSGIINQKDVREALKRTRLNHTGS